MEKVKHIYIHIPFCSSKCPYCDFYSVTDKNESMVSDYVDALLNELNMYKSLIENNIETVYIGGGTPNIIGVQYLDKLLNGLSLVTDISNVKEFTVEINPGSTDGNMINYLKRSGINRLSIGAQSFLENELKTLGRTHYPNDIYRTYENARRAGFDNINLDLIFSIPGQTAASLIYSIKEIITLYPEHISTYMLTYYENTEIKRLLDKGILQQIEDDTAVEFYDLIVSILQNSEYERYEISNFSRLDKGSLHNINTWDFGNYLGLGPSAHSFINGSRWFNYPDIKRYLNEISIYPNRTDPSEKDKKNEFLILGLRQKKGIPFDKYRNYFNSELNKDFKKLDLYLKQGFLISDNIKIYIDPEKFNVFNSIVSDIMLD